VRSAICGICGDSLSGEVKPHFEIIVPLFFSEKHLNKLSHFLRELSKKIPGGIAVTFVADGRIEDYQAVAVDLQNFPTPSKVILLSRNFGAGPALHAGLEESDYCLSSALASDLQEPIELFTAFFDALVYDDFQIALGFRKKRSDPKLAQQTSRAYWWISKKFIHPDGSLTGSDVFAISRRVREALVLMPELNTNFNSQLSWLGFYPKWIGYDRRPREIGRSTYSIRRKLKLFSDSIYGFTHKPITFMTYSGLFLSSIFFLLALIALFGKITNQVTIPGYATTIITIALGQSLTLLSLGIVGGYVVRSFENSTGRPKYVVAKRTSKNS
jgi:glycosyltransferase involved in cell wall biosynthesis